MTMSTISTTDITRADLEEDLQGLAAQWPQFSAQELRRLRFHVYRRHTGRIQPAEPVRAEVDALCAALLARSSPPAYAASELPADRVLSRLWVAWAE
jgi:hypothetical protein